MNEREATQLLERLGGKLDVAGAPVERVVDAGRQASRRRRRWQVGGTAAAVAVVAIGAGVVAQHSPANDTTSPTSPTTSPSTGNPGLVVPPGTRLVGANGVVVAVPASFSTNDTPCGAPNSDTVTFNNDGPWPTCSTQDLTATLVDIVDRSSSQWQSRLTGGAPDDVVVDGMAALDGTDCLTSRPPICTRVLTFPDAGVSFKVTSHGQRGFTRILDSAQAVPDGYVTVPNVATMPADDAAAAIESAGLSVDPPCAGLQCAEEVIATDPPAGTPLRDGSAVSLQFLSPYRGEVPSEGDLVGTWRPSRIGDGPHIDGVRRSGGSPLLLSFRPWHSTISWDGYDGCNWTSGRVRLVAGGFSTSQDATTTRGCLNDYEVFQLTIPDVITASASVTLLHGHLRFYDSSRDLIAVFVPTSVAMF